MLSNKTFVVTGVTSGIGLSVAKGLIKQGASLIGVGRDLERCRQTEKDLFEINPKGQIAVLKSDLSIQGSIISLAQDIRKILKSWEKHALDGLVNNAATVPFWETLTADGIDMQWAVNHLAPFLLTHELLPLLKMSPQGRVVAISSFLHYRARLNWHDIQHLRHYDIPLKTYNQTKLANVLFTVELNRRLGINSNVRAFAADPGLVNTKIGLKSNSFIARWVWDLFRRGGISPEKAAKGIIFLATEASIQNSKDIYWRHGRPKTPSRHALDPLAAKQLWEISSKMCKIA